MATPQRPHYYCHACAAEQSLLNPPPTDPLTTRYQLDKYVKHTVPDEKYQVQSVFERADIQVYRGYLVDGLTAGSVEVDGWGRTNVIWVATQAVGFQFQHGRLVTPQDAVKVVLSTATGYVHAYPASSTTFTGRRCDRCGQWVIQ